MLSAIYNAVPFGIWAALIVVSVIVLWTLLTIYIMFKIGGEDEDDEDIGEGDKPDKTV